jgi:hypothetical protein
MSNFLSRSIIKYFRDRAIKKINADPSAVARQHFGPVSEMLVQYGNIESLYWIGSYEHNMKMIDYFKHAEGINNRILETDEFKKSTEDEEIIDILLGSNSDGQWFLAFFYDKLSDVRKGFILLDTFEVSVDNKVKLNVEKFASII